MIQIEATTVPEILRATRALAGLSTREMGALLDVEYQLLLAAEGVAL